MSDSLLLTIEGALAVVIVLVGLVALKRIQSHGRSRRDAPDLILRDDRKDK